MRMTVLMAVAGLTLLASRPPARAQYYGWGFSRPYYPVPYGYYPGPYYAPPPEYDPPPRRVYRHHAAVRIRRASVRRQRVLHRQLINPLLGPLPGVSPR